MECFSHLDLTCAALQTSDWTENIKEPQLDSTNGLWHLLWPSWHDSPPQPFLCCKNLLKSNYFFLFLMFLTRAQAAGLRHSFIVCHPERCISVLNTSSSSATLDSNPYPQALEADMHHSLQPGLRHRVKFMLYISCTLMKRWGKKTTLLYPQTDGDYPNHLMGYSLEQHTSLKKKNEKEQHDLNWGEGRAVT